MKPEAGSVTVATLGVVVLVLGLVLGLTAVAQLYGARERAIDAAEAAALAAAPVTFRPFGASGTPWQEAAQFAQANGGELTECVCENDPGYGERTVVVTVQVGVRVWGWRHIYVQASAAAEFRPTALLR